ncbi:penicillin-binding protein 1C [Phaeobacter sp. J2-8]|uniref:penicillin-binding protein 1C n=1 Tax=Phaeobacter sp. J2-8 TaxID=2931394 RepID=UPI001FD47B42|nr:penicillin-binding protein 1C [Phaeobacter sp. J2-8]
MRWLCLLVLLLWGGAVLRDGFDAWVEDTVLPPVLAETSVEVLDRNGRLLRGYTVEDGRWRFSVTLDEIDPKLVDMLVAYEDKRFWDHPGVDGIAISRAVAQALRNGRMVSGGSTLTMQVARLLEDSGTGALAGKIRQARLALALERKLTKREILTLYFTHAPYGGNLEGVRAATLGYFGKEPRRLTPAEAAMLVALPQSPEGRRPDKRHARAVAARDRVLARMQRYGVIDADTALAARREVVPTTRHDFPVLAAHLADRARDDAPFAAVHDLTIDRDLQARLEDLAARAVRGEGDHLSIAMVVADHVTGEVLASVGSAGLTAGEARDGFIDMTQALRSPGSTLKPLIYALAFDRGLAHPQTLIDDTPVRFGAYAPQNFDGQFRGEVTVERALQMSLNIPVVKLTEALGPAHLMAALRRSGAEPALQGTQPGLAIALGGLGLTLEDMVQLYASLAQMGRARPLYWRQGATPQAGADVTGDIAAWQVGHILADMVPPPGAPRDWLAYKTGTSYGHRDAWSLGFDGRHVAGVWMGRPDGTPVPGAFGGDMAAPVLFEAFQLLKTAPDDLPPPPAATLMLRNADLPQPLRRFRARDGLFSRSGTSLQMAFPPDGAVMAGNHVTVKLRHGVPPFTLLVDGAPVITGARDRVLPVVLPSRGFSRLAVIDAAGASVGAMIQRP